MRNLFHNVRFYILTGSVILSLIIYLWIITSSRGNIQVVRLVEDYGLISLVYLYITLLIGPFCYRFRSIPYRAQYIKARRALGVTTFYFAFLHTAISFFEQLGGFAGLGFLNSNYLIAIGSGFVALFIFFLLVITSFDYAVAKLSFPKWKLLQRFVYFAGILVLVHTVMLGTHFSPLSDVVPQIAYIALALLLILEVPRVDTYMAKFIRLPRFSMSFVLTVVALSVLFFTVIHPLTSSNGGVSFGIHGTHGQFESHQNSVTTHLIITDSALSFFSHSQLVQQGAGFAITSQFPRAGNYHVYVESQPYGDIEQQVGNTLPIEIGNNDNVVSPTQPVDTTLTKIFGKYEVTLDTHDTLNAKDMSRGAKGLSFTIKDAQTKKPITTLKPYLGSFGHLILIHEKTYDLTHVEPYSVYTPLPPDANGGPTVYFTPIEVYAPFKPGIYRVFAEFNPDNKAFTADFTVKIN